MKFASLLTTLSNKANQSPLSMRFQSPHFEMNPLTRGAPFFSLNPRHPFLPPQKRANSIAKTTPTTYA